MCPIGKNSSGVLAQAGSSVTRDRLPAKAKACAELAAKGMPVIRSTVARRARALLDLHPVSLTTTLLGPPPLRSPRWAYRLGGRLEFGWHGSSPKALTHIAAGGALIAELRTSGRRTRLA